MTDTVAARSGWLCSYMNNHPDTLVAYVRHFGKVKAPVESASLTNINAKSMTLSYVAKGTKIKADVTVSFKPQLSGYEEVRPRLVGMKIDAEEALGMIKRPEIPRFQLYADTMITGSMLIFLFYVTFSVARPYSTIQNIGPWIRDAVGPTTLRYIWIITGMIHGAESLYVASFCRRHSASLASAAPWVFFTFAFGLPVLSRLRKTIQQIRIESIAKMS